MRQMVTTRLSQRVKYILTIVQYNLTPVFVFVASNMSYAQLSYSECHPHSSNIDMCGDFPPQRSTEKHPHGTKTMAD